MKLITEWTFEGSPEQQYGLTETATVIWRHICLYMNEWTLSQSQFGWYRGFINSSQMQFSASGIFYFTEKFVP